MTNNTMKIDCSKICPGNTLAQNPRGKTTAVAQLRLEVCFGPTIARAFFQVEKWEENGVNSSKVISRAELNV